MNLTMQLTQADNPVEYESGLSTAQDINNPLDPDDDEFADAGTSHDGFRQAGISVMSCPWPTSFYYCVSGKSGGSHTRNGITREYHSNWSHHNGISEFTGE